MKKLIILSFFAVGLSTYAQQDVLPTSSDERAKGFEKRFEAMKNNPLSNLQFISVGPTIMGGRVTDVEVSPTNPEIFYVAYASGGLFYTENNGLSYTSLFDNEMVMSIGDIAVDWDNDIIWVGSGENNSSRSSYSGFGVYVSKDHGKTWENRGLNDSHHIGRIVLHPSDPSTLWVAAMGHLYSSNEERGVFKSTDEGKTWKKTLYIDEKTGAIDLLLNPKKEGVIYAAMWQRERKAWDFTESGPNSGIYRSGDAGETWRHISGDGSSFAFGDGIGRIGLALTPDGENLYALLDNQNRRPSAEEDKKLTSRKLREMNKEEFLKLKKSDLQAYLKDKNFPKEYTADSIVKLIKSDQIRVSQIVEYTEDANQKLFDTQVVGAEVYKSNEYERNWRKTHIDFLDDLVYTYGYYFGQIRISPFNENDIYITGVPILKSIDGGRTFKTINGDNQHVDHHALWINPNKEGHMINGNDGGINVTYDNGEHWLKVKSPPVGQFYTVNVDNAQPYNIYGGLQDNGVWMGPSTYKEGSAWQGVGNYPYKRIMGGDGFVIQIDPRDNETVYTGYQFGHYFRFNKNGGVKKKVTPRHKLGERPLRFNWKTPICLSKHQPDVFYIGSNKFHRSLDKGDTYDLTSKDLTKGGKKGDVAFGTLTCIEESPLKFGLIYVGTDDGLVHRSDDLGYHWTKISDNLPQDLWISGIQPSHHDTARLYIALNAYRNDHFNALIYRSDDYGRTWQRIGENLPAEPVNVIKEDPVNENILYLGTDHGLYISLNAGKNFYFQKNEIPSVAVHDIEIQERDKDLIVATHGRSIFKTGIKEVQQLNENIMEKSIHLYIIPSVKYRSDLGKIYNKWKEPISSSVTMSMWVKNQGVYDMKILTKSDVELYQSSDTLEYGLNYHTYDLSIDELKYEKNSSKLKKEKMLVEKAENGKYYLKPGEYKVIWSKGKEELAETELIIKKNEKK